MLISKGAVSLFAVTIVTAAWRTHAKNVATDTESELIRRLPAAAATSGAGEEDPADQGRLVREEDSLNWSCQ